MAKLLEQDKLWLQESYPCALSKFHKCEIKEALLKNLSNSSSMICNFAEYLRTMAILDAYPVKDDE
ncbi:Uncharacterised protein [Phocoenobacter uteri]|uniref:Uncharacterized protein n=1 Tax=Phocoenobacter uteri TaxID=146806 RepID=A0A379CB73_9PAST|nr:hypothetical protein [Phocoenobacter uteri]MDG6882778.1 hypothetical protein [Phocoenobacter uteri]SUB58946.1 Uncharacterised protein [Phocoenobacter uteri]SUB76443.1 Uncharacterised protein [Phocoenobacter uteri]